MQNLTNTEVLKMSNEVAEQLYILEKKAKLLIKELESREFTDKQEEKYNSLGLIEALTIYN